MCDALRSPFARLDATTSGEGDAAVARVAHEMCSALRDDDELVGVMATAGRWIKLLAVDPAHRRRGIATKLLEHAAGDPLRVMDHPGNYLSPGLDGRYLDGRAFFAARGFRELGVVAA